MGDSIEEGNVLYPLVCVCGRYYSPYLLPERCECGKSQGTFTTVLAQVTRIDRPESLAKLESSGRGAS